MSAGIFIPFWSFQHLYCLDSFWLSVTEKQMQSYYIPKEIYWLAFMASSMGLALDMTASFSG